jgi:hypothetical protein
MHCWNAPALVKAIGTALSESGGEPIAQSTPPSNQRLAGSGVVGGAGAWKARMTVGWAVAIAWNLGILNPLEKRIEIGRWQQRRECCIEFQSYRNFAGVLVESRCNTQAVSMIAYAQ